MSMSTLCLLCGENISSLRACVTRCLHSLELEAYWCFWGACEFVHFM